MTLSISRVTPERHGIRRLGVTGALVVIALVSACGAQDDPTAELDDAAQGALAAAKAAGADQSQLDVLVDGTVEYAEYESAMNRSFDCLRKSDFAVLVKGTRMYNGVQVLDFEISGTTSATDLASDSARALMFDCTSRYSDTVESFWQSQSPDALAFNERRAEAVAPVLRACLEQHDVDLPADATLLEMINQANDLTIRDESVDCLTDSGYFSWEG